MKHDSDDSFLLLQRWRGGDDESARRLMERYLQRLIGLAHANLSSRLLHRIDPEEIANSVYRVFFKRAQEGRVTLEQRGDLWRLLAAIAIRKIRGQIEFHRRQKRDAAREVAMTEGVFLGQATPPIEAWCHQPRPEETAILNEEVDRLLATLDPRTRQVLELYLTGMPTADIAESVNRSPRTVARDLEGVRRMLEEKILDTPS